MKILGLMILLSLELVIMYFDVRSARRVATIMWILWVLMATGIVKVIQ